MGVLGGGAPISSGGGSRERQPPCGAERLNGSYAAYIQQINGSHAAYILPIIGSYDAQKLFISSYPHTSTKVKFSYMLM